MSGVSNLMNAPAFDGRAGSFVNFEAKVALRNQILTIDQQKRAANLLLHMSDVARRVSATAGTYAVEEIDGVEQILEIPRERFAPDAIDSIFQDMVKFMYFKRTD